MSAQGRHLERLFFSSPILIVFLLLSLPGISLLTYYFFSLKYVPTVDIFQASYVVSAISVVVIIPFVFFVACFFIPVLLHKDLTRKNENGGGYYVLSSLFLSLLSGGGLFAIGVYVDYYLSYSFALFVVFLISTSSFVVLVALNISARRYFSDFNMPSFVSILFHFLSFLMAFSFQIFIVKSTGYYREVWEVVLFIILFSFVLNIYLIAKDEHKIGVGVLVLLVAILIYSIYFKPAYIYVVSRFVSLDNVDVVSQDKNGCKKFLGGGTVEDGACIAEGVNVLSNLGDYYLFEKDGARYEVMKEKGIRLIFPAKKDKDKKEPDAKADGRVSSPEVVKDSK